ncbi:MAG TPA: OmpA family protein [Crocinitomix sp.]|nr:OmpA family protein [Crocinitomix sp.]
MKKRLLNTALFSVLLASSVNAQNKVNNMSIGMQFGTIEYSGEYAKEIFSFAPGIHPSFGFNVSKYLTPSFDIRGNFRIGTIDGSDATGGFKTSMFDVNVLLDYKFNNGYILKEDAFFAPYVFLGIGDAVTWLTPNSTLIKEEPLAYFNIPMGLGFKFNLSPSMYLSLETHYNYAISDRLDGKVGLTGTDNKWDDSFLYNSIGFGYNFSVGKDSDGDGVKDKDDKCPNVPGTVNGCPDSDGDGFADLDDKCPDIAGPDQGCPKHYFEHVEIMKRAQKGLFFNTGSAVIKQESYPVLDNVYSLMEKNPNLKISIEGHTDNTGSAEGNKKLSQQRADAAKAYLVNKGIDASRISTTGYGQDKPIADNSTKEGRQKNRRVEFILKY